MVAKQKVPTISSIRKNADYALLFNNRDKINALGRQFLKEIKPFARTRFLLAFELGYSNDDLTKILACKTEKECETAFEWARIRSEYEELRQ